MSLHSIREDYLPARFTSLQIDSARQSEASDDGLSQYSQINEPITNSRNCRFYRSRPLSTDPMSTRRSTRGASRQASSRGASPAISTSDIPATPRRAARRPSNPLPAVGARQSTAYGSNTIPPPAADAPPVSRGFSEVLEAELNPVSLPPRRATSRAPTNTSRNQRRSPTPNASERSFADESGIFQRAGIESSPISEGEELGNIPELPEPNTDSDDESDAPVQHLDDLNDRAERRRMEEMARNTRRGPIAPARDANSALHMFESIFEFLRLLRIAFWDFFLGYIWYPFLGPTLKYIIKGGLPLLLSVLALYAISQLATAAMSGNFLDALPQIIRSPAEMLNPTDVQFINRRLNDLEYKVSHLSSRLSDLDPRALKTIQDMIPDFLVVKKDKHGNNIIPDNFWQALRDKIRDENIFPHSPVDSGKVSSGGTKDPEKKTQKPWDKYMKGNEAQLGDLNDHDIVRKFPHLLEQNHIIPKTEILQLIRQSWEENRLEVRSEMGDMKKKLNHATQQITKLQHDFKDESKAIAQEVLEKFIPSGQLDALAAANLKNHLNYGLTRINYLSKGTGAIVDAYFTSPQYVFPSMDVWFFKRTMRWMIGNSIPVPNAPDTALMKWDEHGDCWCSPSQDADGFGPSLAVIMGSSIYPDQVVIEHIAPTASLEPGAAPREMELLAHIPDPELYEAVAKMSNNIFPDEVFEPLRADGFVRIATWTYDLETLENVQGFPVQLNMKALGAHTNKVIVRSKNNWGDGNVDYTCLYRVRVHGEVVATPGLF
ncbi:hypothetical protein IFR05_000304 [Cadophora sp. M221]|nr:hypothetical protein IFR05_000304 [Cadophora sp. M221]